MPDLPPPIEFTRRPHREDIAAAVAFLGDPNASVHITAGDTDLV